MILSKKSKNQGNIFFRVIFTHGWLNFLEPL